MIIRTKRVYDPVGDGDGTRILVDRIWPRGMTREKAQVDLWLKEAAPGTALRKWFAHDPPKWDEFKTRYFSELDAVPETVRKILDSASDGPITLLFSSRDTRLNQAVALKEFPENLDRVAKSPIRDLTLPGKGKTSFSLSLRIKDSQPKSLIRAPRAGRVDDLLRGHQSLRKKTYQGRTNMKTVDARTVPPMENPHGVKASRIYDTPHAQVVHITLEPGQSLRKHVTPVDVFFYVLEGTGVVEIGDEKKEVGPDTLIDSPAKIPHCWYNEEDAVLRFLVAKVPRPVESTKLI